ncbi:unnamed protein product [Ectocarpus sp. 6 AP-2014]
MRSFLFISVLGVWATSSVRASCDDLRSTLSSPLTGDTTLELFGDADCPILEDNELEEFTVEGGTLTLTGPSTTKFTNLKFTIMDQAGLIFDYDTTEFGPNLGYEQEDSFGGFMVQVLSGGSVEFLGEMAATGLANMRSVFYNEAGGNIEFADNAVFDDIGTNVFRSNLGRLRFYGDATFTNNIYLAIDNEGGSVRINGEATFIENGRSFDGHSGGGFSNTDGGTAIFRGPAVFSSNACDESGGGVYNGEGSKMTFYQKTGLYDNWSKDGNGGGMDNRGELKFRGAVWATGNRCAESGGGISTGNEGTTTFYGWVTIQSNDAGTTGGGMSTYVVGSSEGGSVIEFRKPARVDISINEKTGDELGCNSVYVDDTSSIVGFNVDDVCEES